MNQFKIIKDPEQRGAVAYLLQWEEKLKRKRLYDSDQLKDFCTLTGYKKPRTYKTFENETSAPSPMVQISLKEYDKLKEKQHFITDKNLIACIDKIEELVRAIRKHIVRSDIE